MGGRIEIPITEYNALKHKIQTLESSVIDVSKESAANKEKLEKLKTLVMDLEYESLLNRIIHWKKIVKPFKEIFKKKE